MKFASIRIVTNDVDRQVSFYEQITGHEATRLTPDFAELRLDGATLAISSARLIRQFNAGAAIAASNRSAIIEFEVTDVDATLAALDQRGLEIAMPPTDMPWGNRSLLLRDPDGNVVNLFTRQARQD